MRVRFLIRFGITSALSLCAVVPLAAQAQTVERCFILCRPELKVEPTITFENIFKRHRVAETQENGDIAVERAGRETKFETVVSLDIPTQIPHVGITFETILAPFVKDNEPELELELNLIWLRHENTRHWVESHFDIVNKFSPAERRGGPAPYTNKLNFEFDTAVSIFKWLPQRNWLSGIEVETSLDYVATGLPRRGDRIGNVLFLDNASGWSFSVLFILPLAPLAR